MKWSNNPNKFSILLTKTIDELNNNPSVSAICIVCVFQSVLEWEPFAGWSQCSAKCDGGVKKRYRQCNTGRINDCIKHIGGSETEEQECNTFKCEWLPYGKWSECSRLCLGGTRTRERECSTGNIQDCMVKFGGSNIEEGECNKQKCKWVERGREACTASCGFNGMQQIHRYCESGNDKDCDGDNFRYEKCWNFSGCAVYGILAIVGIVIVAISIHAMAEACDDYGSDVIVVSIVILVLFAILYFLFL